MDIDCWMNPPLTSLPSLSLLKRSQVGCNNLSSGLTHMGPIKSVWLHTTHHTHTHTHTHTRTHTHYHQLFNICLFCLHFALVCHKKSAKGNINEPEIWWSSRQKSVKFLWDVPTAVLITAWQSWALSVFFNFFNNKNWFFAFIIN